MGRRGSIARLMVAVGLIALVMNLLRAWWGPDNFLGYIAPIAILALIGLILVFATDGPVRRFSIGLTVTSTAIGIAVLAFPETILGAIFDHLISPAACWFETGSFRRTGNGLARWELVLLWEDLADLTFWPLGSEPAKGLLHRLTHRGTMYTESRRIQPWTAIPQVILACLGGWIATLLRSRRPKALESPERP